MAGNGTLWKVLLAMKSGSSKYITKVCKYKFKRVFYVEKILSSCDLADKCLSRNYNMETYIPNDVIEKES